MKQLQNLNKKIKKDKGKIWIVGGDSKIGKYLSKKLKELSLPFVKTSRVRKKGFFYLDLLKKLPKIPLEPKDKLVLLAGITNMAECERQKKLSKKINFHSQKNLIDQACEKKCFTIYLSSSRVFSGRGKTPSEKSAPKPFNYYGKLKLKTEQHIKKNHPKSAILRITKVIETKDLKRKKKLLFFPVYKSSKILMAPVPINNVIHILVKILKSSTTGVFHLSSKDQVSYYEFYRHFNDKTLVQNDPKTKKLWGKNPRLSMKNTIKKLNIKQKTWKQMFS